MVNASKLNVESVTDYIVNWLKTYAENAKVKGFVVGISGGIDSALTSTLCDDWFSYAVCRNAYSSSRKSC